ncbi:MAG: heme exporter protein CcmB [Gammaproteobacteria bacterium]
MTVARVFSAVVRRELRRAARSQSEALYPLIFFVLAVVLYPFALGPDPTLLAAVAGGVVWVAALLAASLSLDTLFRNDYADGSLELVVLSGAPLAVVALAKAAAHWLLSGLPILLLAVPLALALELGAQTLVILLASLALGSASMSLVGTAVSALTVGLRGGGMLLAMLILPLYIPLLIFGAAATANAALGLGAAAELYFLAGLLVLAITLTPWATAAALRIRMG